ncbi:MAG: HigA family addiction module antitoxin [Bacteroidetes bacterium]|nr:HigA family addiction module antitoxin [Bacteroidota bacterium]MCL5267640.1 HigA family addiction module antitoxin [Bacteroidota bacterium]
MKRVREKIEPPSVGTILSEEYLKPNEITSYRLAKEIGVSTTTVLDIIAGKRRLTVDTALRLSKFFGTSERFWLNLQNDIDIRMHKEKFGNRLQKIRTITQAQ